MKILVTGGAGFIGSHIVEHFQHQAEVRVLDNLRSGFKHNLAGLRHQLILASVLDHEAVSHAMEGVDYVFHLAAMVSVPESMQDPIECEAINSAGTLVVLEAAARAKVKKLIFSSSAAVYGDNPESPKVETLLPEPKSPYAISKLAGEHYCRLFNDQGRVSTACLRYFNVFGPRQDPRSKYAAAVPIFIDQAVRHQPLTIHGDGEHTRDFISVRDVVAANCFLAMKTAATGVFNVACGQSLSINELAGMICHLTNSHSAIQHLPERPGDVKHSLAAIDKLRATGCPLVGDFNQGLRETVEFFQSKTQLE